MEETSSIGPKKRALIREIILEGFMSYEYARIPLKPGLNLVCGPNGAGKSSILLALAVALGQAYTERSRKLSDLIRRGKDLARVTLILDNTPVGGNRPIPGCESDLLRLSRYLRRDGVYWYEAEYKEIAKAEMARLLSGMGINPDNMLIIMHQNMMEEFSVITAPQRLKMVEDAVGFQPYREKILEAYTRLTSILSEEESLANLINNAEQTLTYWRGEYDKYLRRNELLKRKSQLESEQAWAQVIKLEKALQGLRDDLERRELRLKKITDEIEEAKAQIEEAKSHLNNLRFEQKKALLTLLEREKERASSETALTLTKDHLSRLEEYQAALEEVIHNLRSRFGGETSTNLELAIQPLQDRVETLHKYEGAMKEHLQTAERKLPHLEEAIAAIQSKIGALEEKTASVQEKFIDTRVDGTVQIFRKESIEDEVAKIAREIKTALEELRDLTLTAEKTGQRVDTQRNTNEINDEIKLTLAHLASLGEVSEDAEEVYKKYLRLYEELKGKAEVVSENRRKALQEIEVRKQTWKRVVQNFLEKVDPAYQRILSKIGANGGVKLVNSEDIEAAGLELLVGFRGVAPTVLDAYTQSGGERTTAIMAFLLALQQHVRSPIRAVDEFEMHMDPRNREIVSQLIVSSVKDQQDIQYIVITPGQITLLDQDTHIITVQNVQGRSEVRGVV